MTSSNVPPNSPGDSSAVPPPVSPNPPSAAPPSPLSLEINDLKEGDESQPVDSVDSVNIVASPGVGDSPISSQDLADNDVDDPAALRQAEVELDQYLAARQDAVWHPGPHALDSINSPGGESVGQVSSESENVSNRGENDADTTPGDDGDVNTTRRDAGKPIHLVTVASFASPAEAHLAASRLEEEGIPTAIADENVVATNWLYTVTVGGVKVQVAEADLPRAAAILESITRRVTEGDAGVGGNDDQR